jgi:hypothetical protein
MRGGVAEGEVGKCWGVLGGVWEGGVSVGSWGAGLVSVAGGLWGERRLVRARGSRPRSAPESSTSREGREGVTGDGVLGRVAASRSGDSLRGTRRVGVRGTCLDYDLARDMALLLPYDPGRLPNQPAPPAGCKLEIPVDGLPPYKDRHFSIRNPRHKHYSRFVALRRAASQAMAGRAWTHSAIDLELLLSAPALEPSLALVDYVGGVMDTLGGGHGCEFTYLPIVFNDDSQVGSLSMSFRECADTGYVLRIAFCLGAEDAPG